MSIGKLRQRIDILQKSVVRVAGGGQTETWTVETTLWASVIPKTSNYLLNDSNKINKTTQEIIIRATSILTSKKKIRFDSRFFDIDSFFDVDERGRFVKIKAMETTNADVTVTV
tara:strand:+ start:254 stop:595 length:342 start_codon:yes stop_codon:yes gene_type:complete